MANSEPIELEGWALRSISAAVAKELPALAIKPGSSKVLELRQKYFRLFRVVEISTGQGRLVHAAYRPDNSSVVLLSGRQECLRLMASIDPVVFKSADEVLGFSEFANKLTSEDPEPPVTISTADELGRMVKVTNGDRERLAAIQEKFRERVQPAEKMVLDFGFQERFHCVCREKLIERTLTIASGGLFYRQDEILADDLPVSPSR